jgi:transposase-like protein
MEKSNKRGKIPQSDWPSIMARYEAGETLSSIARTYDCSPPAISYIVNRSRARQSGSAQGADKSSRPAVAGEAQLIKAAANGAEHREPSVTPPVESPPQPALVRRPPEAQTSPQADHRSDQRPAYGNGNGNGSERPHWSARDPHPSAPRPSDPRAADLFSRSPSSAPLAAESHPLHHTALQAPANVDHRARLHLQLGNGTHGNAHSNEPRHTDRQHSSAPQHASNGNGERPAWSAANPQHQPGPAEPQHHRPAPPNYPQSAPHHQSAPPQGNGHVQNGGHPESRKENGGSFIDSELRARVDADIAAFLAAFDAALAQDTPETRGALREATDRLLRAGARTRIELERLEARMPMPARDSGRSSEAWRQR